jgi:hypothetical protein
MYLKRQTQSVPIRTMRWGEIKLKLKCVFLAKLAFLMTAGVVELSFTL